MNAISRTISLHTKSKRHIRRVNIENDVLSDKAIDDYCLDSKVAIAEISISALVANRNFAYLSLEYLIPVFKNVIDDSEIIKNIKLYPKKAKFIINNIIAPEHQLQLATILKTQKFGVTIDESTDISVHQYMVITVKYEDEHLLRINETKWDIIKIYDEEDSLANAEHIYSKFKKSFESFGIPLENIISFSSDTCNLMVGELLCFEII